MSKIVTKEEFIERSIKIHGEKYDYSMIDFVNMNTKVEIYCKEHDIIFEQAPCNHVFGKTGCVSCQQNKRRMTQEEFILKAKEIHGERYDYSLVKYINSQTKVTLICSLHGEFEQKPNKHILGNNCKKCIELEKRLTTEQFIQKAINIHGDRYDYSLVDYKTNSDKVPIICKEHGVFHQSPAHHIHATQKQGCPTCRDSKGEMYISKLLDDNNVKYTRQYKFDGCVHKRKLPFDFYLHDYNICIEYDGAQHSKSVKNWGGDEALKTSIIRDNIKNNFCLNNNINLIRIPYTDNILNYLGFLVNT